MGRVYLRRSLRRAEVTVLRDARVPLGDRFLQ